MFDKDCYKICAQALPYLPPVVIAEDDDAQEIIYPVTGFCQLAHPYSNEAYPSGYAMSEDGATRCNRQCPMFTDKSRTVSFVNCEYRAELYLDRLLDLPIANLRKIFKLILSEAWSNDRAIAVVEEHLQQLATAHVMSKAERSKQKKAINALLVWSDLKARLHVA